MAISFGKRWFFTIIITAVVSAVLFLMHQWILSMNYPSLDMFYPLWEIYCFHFLSLSLVYSISSYMGFLGKTVINYFFAATILKMIAALIFLWPLIKSDLPSKKMDVLNFFIPYFVFLAIEIILINSQAFKKGSLYKTRE